MIIKIKQWCEGIIIAVIISVIIEMLIPDGKNKKYIKVIIGIYIMFVTLSPILEVLNYDFNFDNFFDYEVTDVSQSLDDNIKDVYITGIENTIKNEIEEMNYNVDNIKIYTDINYENIEKIEIKINGKNGEIEEIVIGEKKKPKKYDDIINLLMQNYSVSIEQIIFK